MIDKRFPVANTDPPLTIPWEVADTCADNRSRCFWESERVIGMSAQQKLEWDGGFTESELDTWYGRHWREVAE